LKLLEIEREKLEEEAEKQRQKDKFVAEVEFNLKTKLDSEHAKQMAAKEQEKNFVESKL
jgi:hypothetical protein